MRIFCKKLHEIFSSYSDYAFALCDCAKQKKWPPRVAPLSGLCVKKSPDCEISPHNIIIHLCHILSRVVVWRQEKCAKFYLLWLSWLQFSHYPHASMRIHLAFQNHRAAHHLPSLHLILFLTYGTIKRMKSPAKRRKSPEPSTLPQPEKDTILGAPAAGRIHSQ